ncbi:MULTISPECIES: TspO/MBR family protein [unclassified Sphingomonas]|uniref:TspO/MBR family protein n=1 Tax=unclassified Sphingomonas TaxID=196159 RepID=UPI001AD23A77|nr:MULTISPECIES: TspO/MBR family protein [unclassified Sphingomonas]MBN8846553.1 tryptophan-rich sensory protein [Sphingomonas sp.]
MGGLASRAQLRLSFLRWAVVTVPLILLLGFLSGRSVPVGSESIWYQRLVKPPFTPPDWVFPVAWGLLYLMIGLALAMILHARGARGRGMAIALFVVQLVLNLAWTPLFFGAHHIWGALADLIALLLVAIVTTLLFGRIRTMAAWLMLPYLLWIAFAGVLTLRIGELNPGAETLVPGAHTSQVIG